MRGAGRGIRVELLEARTLLAAAPLQGLDLSFGGGDGVLDVPVGVNVALSAAAVTPEGKFVVCGYTRPVSRIPSTDLAEPDRDYFLARLNADGSLDPTFGPSGTGVVVRNFRDGGGGPVTNYSDEASSLALMPDERIVVGGTFGVLLYDADGTPYDPSGSASAPGRLTIDVPYNSGSATLGWVSAVAAAPSGAPEGAFYAVGEFDWYYLVRRTLVGAPDGPFGPPLWADRAAASATGAGTSDDVNAMLVTPDGHVVMAGQRADRLRAGRPVSGMGLVRYDASGNADLSFGNARAAAVGYQAGSFVPVKGLAGGAVAMAMQPDGKVVAVGTAIRGAAVVRDRSGGRRLAAAAAAIWVARFNADGTEDLTFGKKGSTYVRAGRLGVGTDVEVLGDGRIVVGVQRAANVQDAFDNAYGRAVVRLTSDGRLDRSFGGGARGRGTAARGVLVLPVAPAADRWGDDATQRVRSPDRTLVLTDAQGRVTVFSAENSVVHVARLANTSNASLNAPAATRFRVEKVDLMHPKYGRGGVRFLSR